MASSLTDRLGALYASAVHDVLRAMGHERVVLPSGIRPLDPKRKVAGEVWTVGGNIDRTRSAHETLLGWVGVLSQAPRGKVVVCQPNTHAVALMGELSAAALVKRGVLGYVVDGGCRDVDLVEATGLPVFCSFFTPSDIVGRWMPDRFGAPVTIGEVTVSSGDYVLGDRDGVVVVPGGIAAEVVARTEDVARTENQVRSAILSGMDPVQAYETFRKF